ncbi:MAG: hypothetical protein WCQ95_12930 [Bacteroidota bacterium]
MKTAKLVLPALLLLLYMASCKKDPLLVEPGTYTGTFKVVYSSGTQTGTTTMELKSDNTFTCVGHANHIPAGGSGTYAITGENQINFSDVNFWTANFDWNLILNGPYYYAFDGKHLKIWTDKNHVGSYAYELEKN